MRFLKTLTLNRRAIYDSRVALTTANDLSLVDSQSIILPKGNGTISNPVTGQMRYNTTSNEVEVYQGSSATWRSIRYKESTNITQQTLGVGDFVETIFGPLNPAPPTIVESGATWSGANIIVIVENVIQIFNTNYTITQAPGNGKAGTGYWVTFDSPVPTGKAVTVLHGFDK
jgi:hypothetical protein